MTSIQPFDQVHTIQQLYLKTDPSAPVINNDTADYANNGKHFWNLAIRTTPGVTKEDLYQQGTLYVDDPQMRQAMSEALRRAEGVTDVTVEGNQINYTWGR